MRKLLLVVISTAVALSLTLASPAFAKHSSGGSRNPTFSAVKARNSLSITGSFRNLTNVKSISYQLTYDSNKGPQGAGGTIKVGKYKSLSRKLLFGTCSGRVCTYHRDVRNTVFSVDFNLKSGGVVSYEKKF